MVGPRGLAASSCFWAAVLSPAAALSPAALSPAAALSAAAAPWPAAPAAGAPPLRVVVVGDCHGMWDGDDAAALAILAPDVALFAGDFGDEDLAAVEAIAECTTPKATIFGNHDMWHTARAWRGHHASSWYAARGALKVARDGAQRPSFSSESLEALHATVDDCDVGFRARAFPKCTVVGARPFSKGGNGMYKTKFYKHHWRVRNLDESAARITANGLAAARNAPLLLLAHCGPAGLGSAADAPCGKDWGALRFDWGDADLSTALTNLAAGGNPAALCVFGHLHSPTHAGETRTMVAKHASGTLCVNAAHHPRWRPSAVGGPVLRSFTLVDIDAATFSPTAVRHGWFAPDGTAAEMTELYSAPAHGPTRADAAAGAE
ncbi:hypothetical protein M885DRAFT_552966 [Pelagophyceae sp. CCMP2097]|nr:hypothetical protein M885DRAFT_552966 [Pelagophyceae sp. CCMP2097]|mmetsp:Transcript_3623/g.11004  ORF Transcript_3623/g.11004 Transcript_3623/m.11004 type:complete len:377 (-) Transcript_3623:232-1362(-)